MRKNEKQGLLFLRQRIEELSRSSEDSSLDFEKFSMSELDYFAGKHAAFDEVLSLLDTLFFGK